MLQSIPAPFLARVPIMATQHCSSQAPVPSPVSVGSVCYVLMHLQKQKLPTHQTLGQTSLTSSAPSALASWTPTVSERTAITIPGYPYPTDEEPHSNPHLRMGLQLCPNAFIQERRMNERKGGAFPPDIAHRLRVGCAVPAAFCPGAVSADGDPENNQSRVCVHQGLTSARAAAALRAAFFSSTLLSFRCRLLSVRQEKEMNSFCLQ